MIMKKTFLLLALTTLFASVTFAQDARMQRLIDDAANAKTSFIAGNKHLQQMFESAYAYAILPNVGKGAAGIGGAAGSGIVYEQGKMIGSVKMKQLTVGLQLGGQAFREVI